MPKPRTPLPLNWEYVDKPPKTIKQLNSYEPSYMHHMLVKYYKEKIAEQTWNGIFYKTKREYNDARCRDNKRGVYREDRPFNKELYHKILKRVGEKYNNRPNGLGNEQSGVLYHPDYGTFEGTPTELVLEFPELKSCKNMFKGMIIRNRDTTVRGWRLKHYVDQNDIVDFGL